jgi:predicted nucleic acid-binding protein
MDEVLIDTNILVYMYQPEEGIKQTRAVEFVHTLADSARGRLSAQVLAEFVSSTIKGAPPILSVDEALTEVELLARTFIVFDVTAFVVHEAVRGVRQYQMSYYDAQIWATAKLHQVPTIATEDFTHGRVVDGVRFVIPFVH